MLQIVFLVLIIVTTLNNVNSFRACVGSRALLSSRTGPIIITHQRTNSKQSTQLQMNFFSDAVRFFTNLNKEASAKHILIKGPGITLKL